MTEIGPKTQTPALIGDADTSASKDPFAFLSVGGFENLLDAEMIAAVMGDESLEAAGVSLAMRWALATAMKHRFPAPRLCWHWLGYICAPMLR